MNLELQQEACQSLTHSNWRTLPEEARAATVARMLEHLGAGYELYSLSDESGGLSTIRHRATGVLFRLIPGGRFQMGMDSDEWKRLVGIVGRKDGSTVKKELPRMQPAHEVDVAPFLLAAEPLCDAELESLLARKFTRSQYGLLGVVPHEDVSVVREKLAARGWRLPTEAEWEYATRAGTASPFPSGMASTPEDPRLPTNGFGLSMLGELSEVCADGWHLTYEGAPTNAEAWRGEGAVCRGGSSDYWPWQDCQEYLSSLCAQRHSLHGTLLDGHQHPALSARPDGCGVGIRPAVSLFEEVAYGADLCVHRALAGCVQQAPPPLLEIEGKRDDCLLQTRYESIVLNVTSLVTHASEAEATRVLRMLHRRHIRWRELDDLEPCGRSIILRIMELLANAGSRGRAPLILLLGDILWDDHARFLPRLPPADARKNNKGFLSKFLRVLTQLLADDSADVRATTPLLIALMGNDGVALLTDRLGREREAPVRASLMAALGIVSRDGPAAGDTIRMLELELDRASTELERSAAAIGLATVLLGQALSNPVRIQLQRVATTPPLELGVYPWNHGDVADHARRLLREAST